MASVAPGCLAPEMPSQQRCRTLLPNSSFQFLTSPCFINIQFRLPKGPSSGEIRDVQETLARRPKLMAAVAAPEKLQDCFTCDGIWLKGWGTPVRQHVAQLLWFRSPARHSVPARGSEEPHCVPKGACVLTLGRRNNRHSPKCTMKRGKRL